MEVYTDLRSRREAGRSPIRSLLAAEKAHNSANGVVARITGSAGSEAEAAETAAASGS
jgi:hypothetical protein